MVCKICKKKYKNSKSKWCSRACYYKSYYEKNKKRLIEKRKAWHKEHYKPRPFKRRTPEELKEYRKKYYQEHKEYYKQKNNTDFVLFSILLFFIVFFNIFHHFFVSKRCFLFNNLLRTSG